MKSSIEDIPAKPETRDLTSSDLTAGLRLSSSAGWNQSIADWDFLLGNGWGKCVVEDGLVVGTVVVLPYPPKIGWIAMVLVDPKWRGRGYATVLVEEAVAHCETNGLLPILDATTDGQKIYKRLGFNDCGELVRMRRVERRGDIARSVELERDHLPGKAGHAWDLQCFGHDRSAVLNWMESAYPELCLVRADSADQTEAIAWARRGSTAIQIGPVLAKTPEAARSIMEDILAIEESSWIIDVPVRRSKFIGWLHAHGFEIERSFTRMMRGRFGADFPNEMFAVAGPELG